jgi:hypothetical protein
MKDCRIMVRRWGMPTLIAYPPPPPEAARARPILALRRVTTPVPSARITPWEERSARRRRRDCVFIPDMDVALQFVEARRRALEVGRAAALEDALPTVPTNGMDSPLVLGLLMLFAPPLAVTLVWSNRRLPRAAQIALTVYGALVTLAFAAVAIAALS